MPGGAVPDLLLSLPAAVFRAADEGFLCVSLGSEEAISLLQIELAQSGSVSRSEIARRVREKFDLVDSLGTWRLVSCEKALREMHAAAGIRLPAPRQGGR